MYNMHIFCVNLSAVDPVVQGKTRAEQFQKLDKEGEC